MTEPIPQPDCLDPHDIDWSAVGDTLVISASNGDIHQAVTELARRNALLIG